MCLTCDIRGRAARGESPAAIAVRFGIPRFLVEATLGARFPPYPYPSEVGDRRSWAILEPADLPNTLRIGPVWTSWDLPTTSE